MTQRYLNLGRLLSGYFNQDWDFTWASDAEVILAFRRAEPSAQVDATIVELEQLLMSSGDDPSVVDEILTSLGCEYFYEADGLTGISWLERMKYLLLSSEHDLPST